MRVAKPKGDGHARSPAAGSGPRAADRARVRCRGRRDLAGRSRMRIAGGVVRVVPHTVAVERDYTKAILSGDVPGTGGGAPVHVRGWTCQGFTTPVVLRTGQASKCVLGSKEILAILPAPS